MRSLRGNVFLGLLLLGLSVVIGVQRSTNAELRNQRQVLNARLEQLVHLQDAQARLRLAVVSAEELSRLESEKELSVRLREDIARLKARIDRRTTPPSNMVDVAASWRNVGQATPADTLQSVLWAALTGETEKLVSMIAFDAESKAVAQALYDSLPLETRAQYGSVERVIAVMMAGRMPLHFRSLAMIEQTEKSDGDVSARFKLQSKGAAKEITFSFQRDASGWRLSVPASVIVRFQRSLNADRH